MAFGCDETPSTVVGTVTPDDGSSTSSLTYTEYTDGTVAVTAFEGTDTNIVVSATAGGKPVTAIGTVFKGTAIKSISLPDTVKYLAPSAFEGCESLNKITAKGVVTIGAKALDNTKWLLSKPSDELLYFNNVFIGLKYAEKTAVDFDAVEFPSATTSAQAGAFSALTATKTLTLPATMYLEGREFDGFSSIEQFVISSGKGNQKYWKNSPTGELLSADGSVLYKYPEGNTSTTFTIPSSVKVIEKYAFKNAQLETITMSCTADLVKDYAFSNCYNLTSITYSGATRGFKECGGYILDGSRSLEQFETPAILVKLGDNALVNSGVKTVKFRATTTFTEIGKNAFKGLKEFEGNSNGQLTLPDSLEKIGTSAFSNTAVTDVTLGASTKRLGAMAFYGSTIENITLNQGLLTIGDEAFYMTGITSIVLPNSLLSIGNASFASSKISYVYWGVDGSTDTTGAMLEYIGASAFRNTPLTSFNIPFRVTNIGAYAFAETKSMTTVTVNRNKGCEITSSGMYVFDQSTTIIRVPIDSLDDYRNAYGWQDFADRIDVFNLEENTYTFIFNTCGGGTKEPLTAPSISLKKEDADMVHVAKGETPYALLDVDVSDMTMSSTVYILEGWYKDAAYQEKVSFTDAGAVLTHADFTEGSISNTAKFYYVNLYAKWVTYNITFDVHGGSSVSAIGTNNPKVSLDSVVTTADGKTFDGWYYDADTQIAVDVDGDVLAIAGDRYVERTFSYKYSHFVQYTYYSYDVTLHAKWR